MNRRRQLAWETARAASAKLKESFGATRVVVFGSLADPKRFSQWSDIDMAAWDIPPHRYYAAVAAVMNTNDEFEIDLVDPAICRPTVLAAIEKDGVDV